MAGTTKMRHLLAFLIALIPLTVGAAAPPLFYWDARPKLGFSNFGDALSKSIVEKMAGRPVATVTEMTPGKRKLLCVGSIVNYAEEGDILWGTGVNGKYLDPASYRFNTLDIRAVRGPLSRQFLMSIGVFCPEVYGDPTLLLPLLFPEFKKEVHPAFDYVVIPHFSDESLFHHLPHMVSVKDDWKSVVEKILNSKFVISSALSGIIVAEAFGIPARLILPPNDNNTENIFKYQDYYFGSGRFDFRAASSVEEALLMGGEAMPSCDLERLMEAFPYDIFLD